MADPIVSYRMTRPINPKRCFQVAAAALAICTITGCSSYTSQSSESTAKAQPKVPRLTGTSGSAAVEGVRIHYKTYGDLGSDQTPLLVLHGSLMSADAMVPMIEPFLATRPVIAVDARGHGRTGNVSGPITYERMADDAAAVLRSLGVKRADVLGYSMGGTTAIILAVRHPDLVGKQVIVSGVSKRGGWVPASQASFEKWNAQMFAGSPVERAYKRLSSTPDAFPTVIDKLRALQTAKYDVPSAALRAIAGKTMIVAGDYDGLQLSHALELFAARGGDNSDVATKGFLSAAPGARLAILPSTSHIGMLSQGGLLATLAVPFLDDRPPAPPNGFFEGMDKPTGKPQ